MEKTTKQQLILPILLIMASMEKLFDDYELKFNGVSTFAVKDAVFSGIEDRMTEKDLSLTSKSKTRVIDQTFNNIFSHKDVYKLGLVERTELNTLRLTDTGFEKLFVFFNQQLLNEGIEPFHKKESFKKGVYEQFNSGYFPVDNEKVKELSDNIKSLITERVKERNNSLKNKV